MEGPLLPCHHLVLGTLQAKGPRSETEAKLLMKRAIEKCGGPGNIKDFHTFIEPINGRLDQVQLEIRGGILQQTGETFYGVVNKAGDEQAKLGTQFKHAEISFFKAVVEAIAADAKTPGIGSIGSSEAINLCSSWQADPLSQSEGSQSAAATAAPKTLTLSQKQSLLRTLSDQKWLQLEEGGRVSLGIRTYLELKGYLRLVERVRTCEVCNEAAIQAQTCANSICGYRMHSYCVERKFQRTPNDSRSCPECKESGCWPSTRATAAPSQPSRGRVRSRPSVASPSDIAGPSAAAHAAAETGGTPRPRGPSQVPSESPPEGPSGPPSQVPPARAATRSGNTAELRDDTGPSAGVGAGGEAGATQGRESKRRRVPKKEWVEEEPEPRQRTRVRG
eukprot:TRINITY_DN7958_c0_g1_i3.p1 TRINITY_DN7958_c0_g1~~TRINITY_DN7958_c0_g1_i3.p1  ORF type:complete len:391 (-),score=62.10 TRINITY_DN7958_c0_g1_i3:1279-2451(-)